MAAHAGPRPAQLRRALPHRLGRDRAAGLTDLPTIELVSFERIEVKPEPLQQAMDALALGDGAAAVRQGPGSRFVLHLRSEDGREIEI